MPFISLRAVLVQVHYLYTCIHIRVIRYVLYIFVVTEQYQFVIFLIVFLISFFELILSVCILVAVENGRHGCIYCQRDSTHSDMGDLPNPHFSIHVLPTRDINRDFCMGCAFHHSEKMRFWKFRPLTFSTLLVETDVKYRSENCEEVCL